MLTWTPALALGIEELDAQHQELFRRIELFVASGARSRQDVGILLSYLRFYAITHFGAEESWMRERRYPGYAAHKRAHDSFVKELLRLSDENERPRSPALDAARLARFVDAWLRDHIAKVDTDLAAWCMTRSA